LLGLAFVFITTLGKAARVGISLRSLESKFFVYLKRNVMIIESTKNEVIIRLPGNINIDDLQDMTDWFQYKEITRRSKAKQVDVDTLVDQIKKGRWEKRKALLIK